MSPVIEVYEPRLFDGAVADEILASIEERLSEKSRCSLVLAGGSTPSGTYRALSKPPRVHSINWSAIDLLWGDERWVPPDDGQSNYRLVHETLLSQLKGPQPKIFQVLTTAGSPQDGAARYADVVASVGGGIAPQLDIVLLGIGEDGHTASLFPGSSVLTSTDKLCYAVKHPVNGTERVTLASHVLFSAWRVFFIVKGEKKADIVKRVIEGNDPVEMLPARLFQSAKAKVSFLLDSGSAQKLSR